MALKLFDKYIATNSKFAINVSYNVRTMWEEYDKKHTNDNIAIITLNLLAQTLHETHSLTHGSFIRFTKTLISITPVHQRTKV